MSSKKSYCCCCCGTCYLFYAIVQRVFSAIHLELFGCYTHWLYNLVKTVPFSSSSKITRKSWLASCIYLFGWVARTTNILSSLQNTVGLRQLAILTSHRVYVGHNSLALCYDDRIYIVIVKYGTVHQPPSSLPDRVSFQFKTSAHSSLLNSLNGLVILVASSLLPSVLYPSVLV